MTQQLPPAGWYPDETGQVPWWDGTRWTEQTPPRGPSTARILVLVAAVVIGLPTLLTLAVFVAGWISRR